MPTTIQEAEEATMSVPEAGRCFKASRNLAYKLAAEGRFPCRVIRVGKLLRVPRAEVERVLGIVPAQPRAEESAYLERKW